MLAKSGPQLEQTESENESMHDLLSKYAWNAWSRGEGPWGLQFVLNMLLYGDCGFIWEGGSSVLRMLVSFVICNGLRVGCTHHIEPLLRLGWRHGTLSGTRFGKLALELRTISTQKVALSMDHARQEWGTCTTKCCYLCMESTHLHGLMFGNFHFF